LTVERPITFVLGVIGADCHSVGNKILDAFFTEAGFHVVNLGVLVGQDAFIDAAIESNAQAILVSSLYGHAEIDCRRPQGAVRRARPRPDHPLRRRQPRRRPPPLSRDRGEVQGDGVRSSVSPTVSLAEAAELLRKDVEEVFGDRA